MSRINQAILVCLVALIPVCANAKKKHKMPKEKDLVAYLMVYHKDEDHGLHMAVSRDGYTFTALRGDKPIFAGDTIAEQRGIRDPYIFRSPDGGICVAMTDLHVFGQRAGRTTQWERDGDKYGWGNNRGLVLMKSFDLVNWTRVNIDFTKIGPEFAETGCVWAPEMIYDEQKKAIMLYYTTRIGNGPNTLSYVYVNDEFTALTSVPQDLFHAPNMAYNVIDGDIVKVGDKYHLHYVSHEKGATVKHAVSDHLTYGYVRDENYNDGEKNSHEAPNCWKRNGEEKWVVMYDVFGIRPANFGFTETSDFVHYNPIGRFNEGVMKTTNFRSPKHGAVISITAKEADFLLNYYK